MPDNNRYTVWVGGVPDLQDIDIEWAKEIADEWREQGYDDVVIEKYVYNPDHWNNSCQTLQTKFNTGWEWLENNDRV